MAKKNLPFIIVGIVLIALAFYGGMKYGQSTGVGNRGVMANLTPAQQQQMAQQFGGRIGNRTGANTATGDIISNDGQSITINLRSGGSKIIFFSDSTKISKSADGIASDLTTGTNVMIDGTANQDGSITAQTIRINPQPIINPLTNQPKS